MKLSDLSKKSQSTLRKVARASGITPSQALRRIGLSSSNPKVNIHLSNAV